MPAQQSAIHKWIGTQHALSMPYPDHPGGDRVELRQVRSFVVLSEELHFGRAAARLFLAQPALSQQIKQLETHLGASLFNRTSRSVSLSEAGRAFLPHAVAALRNLADGEEELKSAESGVSGNVHLGFVSTAAVQLIPALLQRVKKAYPLVRLTLRETDAMRQAEGLISGEFDIGFMHATGLHPGLESTQAAASAIEVALPSRHPLAKASKVSLKDLASETFLLPARTPHQDLYQMVVGFCESSGFIPKEQQEIAFLQTALPLIAAGAGCALLPGSFEQLRPRGVVFRKLTGRQMTLPIYAVTRRDGKTKLVRNVLQQLLLAGSSTPEHGSAQH